MPEGKGGNWEPEPITQALTKLSGEIERLDEDIRELKKLQASEFVTNEKFNPVRNIVYGMVGIILTGVLGYLLKLAFSGGGGTVVPK